MRKNTFISMMMAALLTGCASCDAKENAEVNPPGNNLGAMTPVKALEYMKTTKDLVIVEVRTPEWLGNTWFTGALLIPHTQMATRYSEIPENRPVILNCGGGVNAPKAYQVLKDKRPDIPQLSYIAGSPLFREYNEWVKQGNN